MKVDKVSYQKAFVIGPYLQERVGFEMQVDDGQDPLEVLAEAKKLAEKFHIENNPHVGESVTYRQSEAADDPIADNENERLFQQTKSKISKVKTREMAELILNSSGFRFNLQLKEIVLNKPSKILNNGKQEKK